MLPREQFIGFLRGQVVKYQWRMGRKGDAAQDAAKAQWYAARLEKVAAVAVAEVKALEAENAALRAEVERLKGVVDAYEKCMDVAQQRWMQLSDIHRNASSNADVAKLVRECVSQWNEVPVPPEGELSRLRTDLAAERAEAAGLRAELVDLCTEVGASVVCGANHNTREVAQAYDRALHAIAATAGRDTLAELERLRAENGKLRGLLDSVVVEVREYVDQDSRDRIQFEAEVRGIPSDCNLGCDDADSVRQWIASRDAALAGGKAVPQ
jgi:predicted  nucleic acid-binding Zn-ribbon protein